MKRKLAAAALVLCLINVGCVHSPTRSSEMERELEWLDKHGYSDSEADTPKIPALALVLDILPIPGLGHYYVGDIGDGLKTTLLFWLIVPWIKGPIDAYKEASFKNDVAYLDYAHAHGWFDHPEGPDGKGPKDPAPSAKKETPPPTSSSSPASTTREASSSQPASTKSTGKRLTCQNCGNDFEGSFCPACGAKEKKDQFCTSCGQKFDGNFCGACGKKR